MSTMKFKRTRVFSDGSDLDQGVTGSLFKDRNLSHNLKGSVEIPRTQAGTAMTSQKEWPVLKSLRGFSVRWVQGQWRGQLTRLETQARTHHAGPGRPG